MLAHHLDDEGGCRAMSWSLTPVQIGLVTRMGASFDAGDATSHQR